MSFILVVCRIQLTDQWKGTAFTHQMAMEGCLLFSFLYMPSVHGKKDVLHPKGPLDGQRGFLRVKILGYS